MCDTRVVKRLCFVVFILWVGPVLVPVGGHSLLIAQTRSPHDGAYRGYLAIRVLENGDHEEIASQNADRLFVPASVLKVVTVAAALEHSH